MAEKLYIADKPTLDSVKQDTANILDILPNGNATPFLFSDHSVSVQYNAPENNTYMLMVAANGEGNLNNVTVIIPPGSSTSLGSIGWGEFYLKIVLDNEIIMDEQVGRTRNGSSFTPGSSLTLNFDIEFKSNIEVYLRINNRGSYNGTQILTGGIMVFYSLFQ